MPQRLKDKVILVTGGTSGIGRETAVFLASEGAKIAVSGRREQEGHDTVALIKAAGGEAVFIRCDIADAAQVQAMVARTVDVFGRLDGAVNNASVEGSVKELLDLTPEDWAFVMRINLDGTFYCLKYEAEAMKAHGGSIVCVASINGKIGCEGFGPYVTTKHGQLGMVKCASAEFSRYKIRVNAVCPGIIHTPMHERLLVEAGRDVYEEFYQHRTHMKRAGKPLEVAAPILWLLSDESSYMTGSELVMDGGTLAT